MKKKKNAGHGPAAGNQKLEQLKGRVQARTRELVDASRALRQSEQLYRDLLSQLPNGVLVHKKGTIVLINDYIVEATGYSHDELIGRSVLDFIHPDDRELVEKNMTLRQAGQRAPLAYEVRAAGRNGEWRAVVIQGKTIEYEGEAAVLSVLIDITEKRHSEKIQDAVYKITQAAQMAGNLNELYGSIHQIISGLMRAENFYIALFDAESRLLSFPYFVDEFDPAPRTRGLEKGLTEYVLRTGVPLLATPEILSELENRGEIELIGAPSIDWLGVPLKIRETAIGVLVVQTYSPGLRYGQDEKNILIFVSNQVAMAIERKRAEDDLRRSEIKNRAILRAMPDLMFLLDKDGIFLDYKSEVDSELLLKPDLFLGRRVNEVLPPQLAELTMEYIRLTLQSRELQVFEYELTVDQRLQFFEARCVLCGNEEVLVVIRNLTEKRRLEQQVLQAQKMESLGTLAGGIAHDFNNILAGILGHASLLKAKLSPEADLFKHVDTIERSAVRAADLTSKLLAFTRSDKVNHKPLNINKLIRETLEIIGHTFDKSIAIESHLDESLPTVMGDAGQIQQVVMNLCVNARDAMSHAGTLSIATETAVFRKIDPLVAGGARPGAYIKLTVSDSGTGMDKEVLRRIFDPFFTTKAVGQGSGLGLSVAYGIVKGHEGFITVSSRPEQGSRFNVFFPACGLPEAPDRFPSENLRGKDELVFVVDDETDIRTFVKEALQGNGYRVLLAANGEQAVEVYRQHCGQIALVILDLIMPGMSGEEAFEKMKEINPRILALLSTGHSQDGRVRDVLKKGVKGFLQKPYDLNQLLAKLQEILALG